MAVILFVEDDHPTRRNIAMFLRLSGYEVYEAEDGEAALNRLSTMPFDVVISDLNLPGQISRIDILNSLKTIPRKVDGILVTGQGSDEIKIRADSVGAAYMEKPLQISELEKTTEQRARR